MTFDEYCEKWFSEIAEHYMFRDAGWFYHVCKLARMRGTKKNLLRLRSALYLIEDKRLCNLVSEHIDAIINGEFKGEYTKTYHRLYGDKCAAGMFMERLSSAFHKVSKRHLKAMGFAEVA